MMMATTMMMMISCREAINAAVVFRGSVESAIASPVFPKLVSSMAFLVAKAAEAAAVEAATTTTTVRSHNKLAGGYVR